MKDNNFTTNPNTVISPENVQSLGEYLAISALKFLRPYRAVNHCYFGLLRDIRNKNNPNYCLSDGYVFAQSATCFLCGYIGKRLGDTIVSKYGKLPFGGTDLPYNKNMQLFPICKISRI